MRKGMTSYGYRDSSSSRNSILSHWYPPKANDELSTDRTIQGLHRGAYQETAALWNTCMPNASVSHFAAATPAYLSISPPEALGG